MTSRKGSLSLVLVMATVALVWLAPAASAACHRFSMEVSPTSAGEGDTVTVTIGRDGSVADSSVRVSAAGQSADSGSDFSALDEEVSFTGSQLEQSVTVDILSDDEAEPSETFAIALEDPQGCSVNPNFSLADEVTVTIAADEAAQSGEANGEEADPQAPVTSEQDPVTPGDTADEDADDEGGMSTALIIAAVIVLVAGGAFLAFKKRSKV